MSRKWKKNGYADSVLNESKTSNSVPWREWSDIEVNAEQWDYPKGGVFADPEGIIMPQSLKAFEWKRFGELNYIDSPIVYEAITSYPDLITKNRHIMHSEFIRSFISTMINLQYCGRNGLEIENPNVNFSWNFGDECWQGWHNVYSLNKAGKGISHRPIINRNGKYIVRIFHMGCWRRIFVDDFIPVDKKNRPLLPRTANVNEIWPMILSKAIIKIASLSWSIDREIVDCSLITCLTGWIELSLGVTHLSPDDQWQFFVKHTKNYELPQNSAKDQGKSETQEKSVKSRKSKNTPAKIETTEESQTMLLFASLKDTTNVDFEGIPGITPCWEHQIYVELSRDVPLDATESKAPLAKWKNHRWLRWAIRRGLIEASDYFLPLRYLLAVSPLGRYMRNILCHYDEDIDDFKEEEEEEEDEKEEDEEDLLSETNLQRSDKRENARTTDLSKTKSNDFEISGTSVWADFNKLSPHLREIHLFYRRKFFEYNYEVSDTGKNSSSIVDGKKTVSENTMKEVKKNSVRSSGAASNVEKHCEYREKIWQSRNEPLYLFIDSINDKFILVNFSTVTINDEVGDSKKSSLVAERHDFFESSIDDGSIGAIKTRGAKSMIFQLPPGRHLLRIFINYQSIYRVLLLSDTAFEVGNRLKMHRSMITEAHRIEKIARKISDSLAGLFDSFGKSSYAIELKTFYRSYMPVSSMILPNSNRRSFKAIHNYFIDEFWKIMKNRFSTDEISPVRRALRIFFLDSSIGIESTNAPRNEETFPKDNDDEATSNFHESATKIQSFFRMAVIKRYKKIHDPINEEHYRTKVILDRIAEIFDYRRRESAANALMREILKRDEALEALYAWASDVKHVIEIDEFAGRSTNFTSDRWFPIIRIGINTEKTQIVLAAIDLFTDVTNYTVRVFDNENNAEMPRVANNVTPNRYSHRENGYTLLAHGVNDLQGYRDVDWLLHLTTIKGYPVFRTFNEIKMIPEANNIAPLYIRELSNTYVPNPQNSIFKLILGARRKMLVTLRLRTSYEKVLAQLRVVRENDDASWEIAGGGSVVLPIIFLEIDANKVDETDHADNTSERKISMKRKSGGSLSQRSGKLGRRESDEEGKFFGKITRYKVEAYVLQDSWPLSAEEWSVVMESKMKDSGNIEKHSKANVSGRKSQRSKILSRKSLDDLRKPYWSLQIVTDFENEPEIIRDTGKDEKIAEFRKTWKIEEHGCSERGGKLREKFINENSLMIAPSAFDLLVDASTRSSRDFIEQYESFYSLENEISSLRDKRTHEPPANLANYLPKLDLTIYMEKEEEEEDRWVKSEFDEETLRNLRAMNYLDFEQLQLSFIEESSLFMKKMRRKYERAVRRYLENRDDRARGVNEIYLTRQTRPSATKNTATSVKSKESTKSKKDI